MNVIRFFLVFLLPVSAFALTRDYLVRELTAGEEKQVVELAKRKGIEEVATIRTYYIAPSASVGISVIEKESRKDGKVRYRVLNVNKRDWAPARENAKSEDILGDFSAEYVWQADYDIFTVAEQEYRVHLGKDVSRADAGKILDLLLKKKIEFHTDKPTEIHADDLQISKPLSLGRDPSGKRFIASIAHRDPLCGYGLTFTIEGDQLMVWEAWIVCA